MSPRSPHPRARAAPSGPPAEASPGVPPAGLADLRPALVRLDLRLRLAVEAFRDQLAERARDPFRGLYITEADVDELLASVPAAEMARQSLARPAAAAAPRLERLARLFGLDAFEQDALLVCLAPDLDLRYERLYAYLQDDATRRRPNVDLILRLLSPACLEERVEARAALGPGGRLIRKGLLTVAAGDEATAQGSLLARPLRVEERVVDFLIGSDELDARVALFGQLLRPEAEPEAWTTPTGPLVGLGRVLEPPSPGGVEPAVRPIVYLQGPPSAGKRAMARAACTAARRALLLVDVPALLAATDERAAAAILTAAVREALLQDAALCLDGFDRLLAEDPAAASCRAAARRILAEHPGLTLLLGEARWEPAVWLAPHPAVRIELSTLGPTARGQLWGRRLNGHLPAQDVAELAARFRLVEDESIRAVAAEALSRAALRGEPQAAPEDLRAAARAIATPPLEGLANRVELRYGWNDIVLIPDAAAQLRELCARLRHQATVLERWGYGRKHARRAGATALFVGPPGTGKTMAAEIIARDLGLDLYRIDLSATVSKYIGETEKNLERIFRAADQGDAVLLFDEADALFGKRSEVRDAHDRYANVEVAYLLQRLETYEGLAILTSNMRGNMDEAFIRRLDAVQEFPLPEEPERLRIWRLALPPEAPVAEDADVEFLARKFKLAGGHIRNIALTAGFLAAAEGRSIGMKHLVKATRREYQKLGKLVAEADFERYYALLRES
ncbi:MAG: ATP-binding protein [Chloroflexi bacterium]|nr:ATP-binding protein [Chloroflexota bacterium]